MIPDLWAFAHTLGEGNISRGIQYALEYTRAAGAQPLSMVKPQTYVERIRDVARAQAGGDAAPGDFAAPAAPAAPEPLDPSLETGAASQARAAAVDAALRARAERLRAAKHQAAQDQDQGHE